MMLTVSGRAQRPADAQSPFQPDSERTGASRGRPALLPVVERRLAAVPDFRDVDGAARRLLTGDDRRPDHLAVGWAVAGGHRLIEQELRDRLGPRAADVRSALPAAVEALGEHVTLSVAEALALRCQQHGLTHAFAYPGTSELALCQALGALGEPMLVNARGDAEAVFMTGGAGMAGHVAAAAVVHGARGLTNATGAIGVLRRNELPALVIVGLPATSSARFLPPHGEPELVAAVGAFAKHSSELTWSAEMNAPEPDPIASVDRAIGIAASLPRGPVLLGVPQDVLEWRGVPPERLRRPPTPPKAPACPPAEDVARARLAVREATRVVVLVDDYLLALPDATEALAGFAEAAGASVFQVRYRRGPMLFQRLSRSRMSQFVGWYDPSRADHRQQLADADLLVTVEDRNLYERVVGPLPECRKLAITSDATKVQKNGYLGGGDQVLEGSPPALLRLLTDHGEQPVTAARSHGGGHPHAAPAPARTVGDPLACSPSAGTGSPLSALLAQAVRGCLEVLGGDLVVDDSQMLGGLLADSYDDAFGTATVRGDHGGFVGAGLSLAAGLAIGSQRPVLCLLGDQGFTNGFQGLVAAAQERASVLYLVANNGESVSLRKQATALGAGDVSAGLDRLLRNCPTFDYVQAATGAGVAAARVDATGWEQHGEAVASRILGAVARVWAEGRGPALIEIVLPPLGPAWDGVWATRGHDEPPARPRDLASRCGEEVGDAG